MSSFLIIWFSCNYQANIKHSIYIYRRHIEIYLYGLIYILRTPRKLAGGWIAERKRPPSLAQGLGRLPTGASIMYVYIYIYIYIHIYTYIHTYIHTYKQT